MFVPKLVEKVFVVLSLLFLSGAVVDLLNESTGIGVGQTGQHPISKVISLSVQLGTFFLVIAWREEVVRTAIKEKLLWILIGLALASTFWSDVPAATLRNSILLVQITLFAVYLAARYSLKEQLQLLAWTFGIGTLLSIVVALVLPSYGVMGMGSTLNAEAIAHAGAWRGIYIHKNPLGRIMVLSSLVFLIFATSNHRERWVGWAGLGLSVSLILLSTSKTALVILLTIIALLPFYKALRWNYTIAVPFFITLILLAGSVATLFVSNAEAILGVLGRDLTLTGRTDVWTLSLEKLRERPWLGYGIEGFWRGMSGESADIWMALKWDVPHSHNGFLDLALDLGWVGFSVFALSFLTVFFRAASWVNLTKTSEGLWPIAYLSFLLLANLTESSLLRQRVLWILYVAVTLSMHDRSLNQEESNLSESNPSYPQKVNEGAIKQVTRGSHHRKK